MTTVYFIRHAEPDFNVRDDFSRPLTEKGRADSALVTEFLRDKNIDAVLSSPFLRARDTVAPFAAAAGLEIRLVEDFRERKVADEWIQPFKEFMENQWADFNYKMENGESLAEVTARNIAALRGVLREYRGKNIAVGTHGTALSAIIHFFDDTYGFAGFSAMKRVFPWVVRMDFCEDTGGCIGMEKIDLFAPAPVDYSDPVVRTAPLGELKAYRYTVIFARYREKWLYCRHRERDTYETAGGRIEAGETPLAAARRELFEETGAVEFDIEAAFDYSVHIPTQYSNGQVFFAKIHRLGEMPDFEMGEVALFDSMPPKMRFPKILPVLYFAMQRWLNAQTARDEICDIYDENRQKTGETRRRTEARHGGGYLLVVLVWILNSRGELLITKRAPTKGFPNLWECTGGVATAGDDSLTTAIREVREETGLTVLPKNGELVILHKSGQSLFDVWLFRQDFDLADVVLQEGETIDAKFATPDEVAEMIRTGEFVACEYFEKLRLKLK